MPEIIHRPEGIPCERCDGTNWTDIAMRCPNTGVDWDGEGECPECIDGKAPCDACGERPAVAEYHWHREFPPFEVPAVDHVCEPCLARYEALDAA